MDLADEQFVVEELPSDDEEPDFDPSDASEGDELSESSSELPDHHHNPSVNHAQAQVEAHQDSPGSAALAHALAMDDELDFGLPLNFEEELLPSSSSSSVDEDEDEDESLSTTESEEDEAGPSEIAPPCGPSPPLLPLSSTFDDSQPSLLDGDQEDEIGLVLGSGGISRRTRANVSLREMTLEELEQELNDEFAEIEEEEAYEDQVGKNSPQS